MTRRPAEPRPRIWAEGRQHPPFDLRAFIRATALFAREGLSGLLARCAVSAQDTAARVQAGALRIPENRLGRTGRYLPSHARVGAAMGWGAEVLMGAALAVNPLPAPPPASSLFTAAPAAAAGTAPARPRRPARAAAAPAAEGPAVAAPADPEPGAASPLPDPDLAAIRALLADSAATAGEASPPAPRQAAAARPAPRAIVLSDGQPDASGTGWRLALLRDMAATALGYGLLLVSLPYGAVRATLAHLNGQDLRDLTAA